jgi:hypothetical protein
VAEKFVYYLGLDLGQSADYTALAIIEEPVWVGPGWKTQVPPFRSGWVTPADIAPSHLRYAIKEARRRGRPPNPPLPGSGPRLRQRGCISYQPNQPAQAVVRFAPEAG